MISRIRTVPKSPRDPAEIEAEKVQQERDERYVILYKKCFEAVLASDPRERVRNALSWKMKELDRGITPGYYKAMQLLGGARSPEMQVFDKAWCENFSKITGQPLPPRS
ncbi:MAG: hypothetical protein KDD42_09375 [Bdellovibrionales bacterium]|nr:hypothetical protein [Bdellovibrionales bacterium]